MNYKIILHTLGWVLNIEAAAMLLPLICALIYSEPFVPLYILCIGLCLLLGIPLTVKSPKNKLMIDVVTYLQLSFIENKLLSILSASHIGTT